MTGRIRLKENGILDEDQPTLLEIVFKHLSDHMREDCDTSEDTRLALREGFIPNEICDRFLLYHQDCNKDIDDNFITVFHNTIRTPLKFVSLRNCSISDEGMEKLLQHNLISLSLWYCNKITVNSWSKLVENSCQLKSLELGRHVDILKHSEPNEKTPIDFQLNLPNLRKLTLNGVVLQPTTQFSHLRYLGYLDLTSCIFAEFSLEALIDLPNLTTLILFNIWPLEHEIHTICKFKNLHTLDISVANTGGQIGKYDAPDTLLAMLVESLPELTHLDISGTNLAGSGVALFTAPGKFKGSDIPGLVSRVHRPLQFLGLYHAAYAACSRHDIPAITISGEANEAQVLTAAIMYQQRPILLTKVLNDLYHLLRFESCTSIHQALDVVLTAMEKHLNVKHMQISGSATLFYIVKGRDKTKFGTRLKNHIIRTLLNGMSMHINDETMMRNGCLTLCQFAIPNDVLFDYERLVHILLHCISNTEQEGFVQRIAIYLLNSLACQVDGRQKLFLGDLGAVTTMLRLIKDRLSRTIFDDVMEVAWSTMWNITDETAVNCERFLDGRGMEYFLGCLHAYPEKDELLRNMMGLLGNVAEVKRLRPRLMTTEYITVFAKLLDSCSDGIEVSYNAAGVLSHIASDGEETWNIETPLRSEVLFQMVRAIERWNLKTERNINYRSFEPILGLVRCYETPECQHWAVWALANLTKVYPLKYCSLVEDENGIELLSRLVEHPSPYDRIKQLAQMVLDACSPASHKNMMLDG